jgi:hypothetical protein
MKYRQLTLDELEELQTEFIRFLAANTVTGDDWTRIKAEDPQKAQGLIEIFSDLVFDKIIAGIEYLEVKTPLDYKTFYCTADKIYLLGLKVEGASSFDFTQNEAPQEMMARIQNTGAQLKLYSAEKGYQPNREDELFRMLENGARIDKTGTMYQLLANLK